MLLLVGDGQGQTNLGQFSIILRAQNKILWFFSIFLPKLNMSRTYWDSLWDCLGLTVGLFGTVWDCLRLPGTAWGCLGLSGIVRNSLGLSGTDLDCLVLSRTLWDCLGIFETFRNSLKLSAVGPLRSGIPDFRTNVPKWSGKGPYFGLRSNFFLRVCCDIQILIKWFGKGQNLALIGCWNCALVPLTDKPLNFQ